MWAVKIQQKGQKGCSVNVFSTRKEARRNKRTNKNMFSMISNQKIRVTMHYASVTERGAIVVGSAPVY